MYAVLHINIIVSGVDEMSLINYFLLDNIGGKKIVWD